MVMSTRAVQPPTEDGKVSRPNFATAGQKQPYTASGWLSLGRDHVAIK